MEQSIKSKLSISIAFIVVLTVLLISILSNLIIKNEFTKYKEKQQLGKIEEIVNSIQDQYNIKENKWDEKNINNIGSEDKLIQNIVNNLKEEYVTKIEENDEYEINLNSKISEGKTLLENFDYNNAKTIFENIIDEIKDTEEYYVQLAEVQQLLSLCK